MDEWDWNAVGTHVNFYKGERVLSVTEAAEELNTLERELAAANAALEEITCGDCDGTGATRTMSPCHLCGGNGISPDMAPLGDYIKALKSED